MTVQVWHGDSRDALPAMDAASVDAVVTDPPYALVSMTTARPDLTGKNNQFARKQSAAGFMGKQWDTGETAFDPAFWAEVLRVLKPGAHLVAFGGTRTYHRLACAIEDAGFEIRDQIGWCFGSGFPKSHDVSKGIDKAAGAERVVIGRLSGASSSRTESLGEFRPEYDATIPATAAARQWAGWGTALKPAWEPVVLARKPLIGTVAANVLAHGTGALNIDGCRVATADDLNGGAYSKDRKPSDSDWVRQGGTIHNYAGKAFVPPPGRWPANLIHDGSAEVVAAFPDVGKSTGGQASLGAFRAGDIYGKGRDEREKRDPGLGDFGSAARFFYSSKADAGDRLGSKHPTVKPVDLMAYLCRLVTPPKGLVLDPFAGSGTTGMACMREGFDCILIEREAEYVADIRRRLAHVSGGDAPLFAEAAQ